MEKEKRHSGGSTFEGELKPKKSMVRLTKEQKNVQLTGAEREGWGGVGQSRGSGMKGECKSK